jgi:hypothetical protein
MEITNIAWSVATGALAGGGVAAATVQVLKDSLVEKVKARYAKELETFKDTLLKDQRRIQARIDRSIFVSRAQFDTEFNAMKDVFKLATDTRLAMEQIRPMFDVKPADQTDEEKRKSLFTLLGMMMDAYNAFSSQMENLCPFYPEALYQALNECRGAACTEINQVRTAGEKTFNFDWFTQGIANKEKFEAGYHKAAVIIRERLERLSVVPS